MFRMQEVKLDAKDGKIYIVGLSGCWKGSWMLRLQEILLHAQDSENLVRCSGCWKSKWMLRVLKI